MEGQEVYNPKMICRSGTKQPDVNQKIEILEERSGELLKTLHSLDDRLSQVMRPPEPADNGKGEAKVNVCPLSARLEGINHTVIQANNIVNDILSRLEVA